MQPRYVHRMNKLKAIAKKGYISIELVIVAGLVLVFGLFAVSRFVSQGSEANKRQENALQDVYSNINNVGKRNAAVGG